MDFYIKLSRVEVFVILGLAVVYLFFVFYSSLGEMPYHNLFSAIAFLLTPLWLVLPLWLAGRHQGWGNLDQPMQEDHQINNKS